MIPLRLRIAGFLSYRDPVEIDFTGFDLACISGHNGAGKSSLLDAITWALFGQARRRDEALINLQSKAAEVTLTFRYEANIYRVQRALPRGKATILEFQVLEREERSQAEGGVPGSAAVPGVRLPENPSWRPLTERTLRETQQCIDDTLRLDYDTFVNASFFLQGRADQFTQQTASKRKEVLGSILGLEVWEEYKARAAEKRKALEEEFGILDRRIADIDGELAEAAPRKQRLNQLESQLAQLSLAVQTQAAALDSIRSTAASLEQQKKLVNTLGAAVDRSRLQLSTLRDRLTEREAARSADTDLIGRAAAIQAAYHQWRQALTDLQEWDKVASAFHEVDQKRIPLLQEIAGEKARLEEEQRGLQSKEKDVEKLQATALSLQSQIDAVRRELDELEARTSQRAALEEQRNAAQERRLTLTAENERLRSDMNEIRDRKVALESTSGAYCPLCGQELTPDHREKTLSQLITDGKQKGDTFRANKVLIDETTAAQTEMEARLQGLVAAETERESRSNLYAQLTERLQVCRSAEAEWDAQGKKRLKELGKMLKDEAYAQETRKQLARLDRHLAGLGYDAAAHDATRAAELAQRTVDEQYRKLEAARAALAPLESEIANRKSEIAGREADMAKQQAEYDEARASLEQAESTAPDLAQVERTFLAMSEQENVLNQEVGAARQKVNVLSELRDKKTGYAADREALALDISRYKALERSLGKDGVPALLIEQALPEIESRANELLDRLSDGRMSVRFLTQAGYKDKKREDLRETLEIQISDGAGLRDYEMYSGGEAFRVDFAVRLALSELLSQRKGARLQTLVIDEGFGSQDVLGRQRLIEAINVVKGDFAKILVITHLEELKDAFPTRIEVEKTASGSIATVM
ncbi:MAG TPA: SMC family ATPase [Anaerolineales bacterium]